MIYFLWLIPIIASVLLYLFYKNIIVFQIGGISVLVIIIYTLIHQSIGIGTQTSDIEWYGNYATGVHYYDDWDEEVPCRHPVYCTRTYECNCDSKGENCSTCTEEYICGHEHSYDVDYHPEYWVIKFDNGNEREITHKEYIYYCAQWENKRYTIELNRDYHSNDGNDVACNWNNKPYTSEYSISTHSYENRVQASNSVFKADKVDTMDVKQYKLYNYQLDGKKVVYGPIKISAATQKLYNYINGYYGSKKQFKLYICVYRNQGEITAERQHSYWENLNKNEFLVCIGLDNTNNIEWCKTYSWMDKPVLSSEVEQYFHEQKKLDLDKFARWLPDNIERHWKRKHFRDFNYIQIELTYSQYFTIFIVVLILSIIQAVVTTLIIKNEN